MNISRCNLKDLCNTTVPSERGVHQIVNASKKLQSSVSRVKTCDVMAAQQAPKLDTAACLRIINDGKATNA